MRRRDTQGGEFGKDFGAVSIDPRRSRRVPQRSCTELRPWAWIDHRPALTVVHRNEVVARRELLVLPDLGDRVVRREQEAILQSGVVRPRHRHASEPLLQRGADPIHLGAALLTSRRKSSEVHRHPVDGLQELVGDTSIGHPLHSLTHDQRADRTAHHHQCDGPVIDLVNRPEAARADGQHSALTAEVVAFQRRELSRIHQGSNGGELTADIHELPGSGLPGME